jgi:hypothetical protein
MCNDDIYQQADTFNVEKAQGIRRKPHYPKAGKPECHPILPRYELLPNSEQVIWPNEIKTGIFL